MAISLAEIIIALLIGGALSVVYLIYRYVRREAILIYMTL
jgi:hypothetical protein